MMTPEQSGERSSRMWRKLGGLLERYACERVEGGSPETGVKAARLADLCFWQATGEGDSITWGDAFPPAKAEG